MSDGHDHEHDDAADAHHDHDFDGEPAKELGPDEPQTPGWLPLVGAAVFVLGAVLFLMMRDGEPSGAGEDDHAGHGHAPAQQTVAVPQPPRPAQAQPPRPTLAQPRPGAGAPGQAQPGDSALPNVKRLTPDQVKDLQKRIQEAKAKKEAGGAK